MGRLAGFSYQEVTRKFRKFGFEFHRQAKGDHEIWINPNSNLRTTIPHHRELNDIQKNSAYHFREFSSVPIKIAN